MRSEILLSLPTLETRSVHRLVARTPYVELWLRCVGAEPEPLYVRGRQVVRLYQLGAVEYAALVDDVARRLRVSAETRFVS